MKKILSIALLALSLSIIGCETTTAPVEEVTSPGEVDEKKDENTNRKEDEKESAVANEKSETTKEETEKPEPNKKPEEIVKTEEEAPLKLSSGNYGIGNNIELENGTYILSVEGSGALLIKDGEDNEVAQEVYTNANGIEYRAALVEGYSILLSEGLQATVKKAPVLEAAVNPKDLSSGYWLASEDLAPGQYRATLKNVYREDAFIKVFHNAELIDSYTFTKDQDNDSYRDFEILDHCLIVIGGIESVHMDKLSD